MRVWRLPSFIPHLCELPWGIFNESNCEVVGDWGWSSPFLFSSSMPQYALPLLCFVGPFVGCCWCWLASPPPSLGIVPTDVHENSSSWGRNPCLFLYWIIFMILLQCLLVRWLDVRIVSILNYAHWFVLWASILCCHLVSYLCHFVFSVLRTSCPWGILRNATVGTQGLIGHIFYGHCWLIFMYLNSIIVYLFYLVCLPISRYLLVERDNPLWVSVLCYTLKR